MLVDDCTYRLRLQTQRIAREVNHRRAVGLSREQEALPKFRQRIDGIQRNRAILVTAKIRALSFFRPVAVGKSHGINLM
ncbi:hypothetical protein D3C83_124060 [compost metagenome]